MTCLSCRQNSIHFSPSLIHLRVAFLICLLLSLCIFACCQAPALFPASLPHFGPPHFCPSVSLISFSLYLFIKLRSKGEIKDEDGCAMFKDMLVPRFERITMSYSLSLLFEPIFYISFLLSIHIYLLT